MLCYPAVEKPLVHRKGGWMEDFSYVCVRVCDVPVTLHKAVEGSGRHLEAVLSLVVSLKQRR